MANMCDKCGRPVPRENDAIEIEADAFGGGIGYIFLKSRHLRPTATCEGSPSRWRLVEAHEEPWYSTWRALNGD